MMKKKRGGRGGGGGGGGGGRDGGGGGGRRHFGGGGGRDGGGNNFHHRRRNYRPQHEPRPQSDEPLPEGAVPGEPPALEPAIGVLELHPNGYGFLRDPKTNYLRERTDPFVPGTMIEKFRLREGVMINALVQQNRKQEGPRVREIVDVDGMKPEDYVNVKNFDDLTAINPESWLRLEMGPEPISPRIMDLLTPLGKGQRALIVAPPRTGKTILMQQISQAIAQNHPEVKLFILLIDERPEEVTDMKRQAPHAEVIASSLDRDVESHVRLSQLAIERCKRLVEMGQDVFLLMDSITRLTRAG